MAKHMLYYLSWKEDEWLDEMLDAYPDVNAMVPTRKSVQLIREQLEAGEVEQAALIVNVSGDRAETEALLAGLTADERLSQAPLLLVGMQEEESEGWQQAFPRARVAAVPPFAFDYDYLAVLSELTADWGD